MKIGLIKEGKIPADNRVALSPAQCKLLTETYTDVEITVQPCDHRCFSNDEYKRAGIALSEDLSHCDLLLGIKEVPVNMLIEGRHYMFFSHTKKKQEHNRGLLQAMLQKNITLIDYECLEHDDGQRIIGFGFFAGIVGAHNGIMAYGKRTGTFHLGKVSECRDYKELINTYFQMKLPPIKIVVTGNGRVSSGLLEIITLMDVIEVEQEEFLEREFSYPTYVHLNGAALYEHKETGGYHRADFHKNPASYISRFKPYLSQSDLLMNGTYWGIGVPPLFTWQDMLRSDFRIQTIADVSDDKEGGIPCNLGDSTIEDPVYGVDPVSRRMIAPYQKTGIDVMAVGNLPNELPRDASVFFGDQLIKYVIEDLLKGGSQVIDRATLIKDGKLCQRYAYLKDFAEGR